MSAAPGPHEPGSVTEEALRLVAALGGAWGHEHPTEEAGAGVPPPECGWCPVCRVLRTLRVTDPVVREHLAAAGSSLVAAVGAMLATPTAPTTDKTDEKTESEEDER